MSVLRSIQRRAEEPELMDDFTIGGAALREALHHLRLLNRIFGASAPTLYGVKRLWLDAGKPRKLTILDIGCGSGDVNAHLLKWADRNRIELQLVLIDITEEACEEARLYFQNEPRVQVRKDDLFSLPEACADIITGTQFVHHFAADELPGVVDKMLKASRLGVVINDIHRHWIPWAAVWLVTRMLSNNRYILHDGPLSVAKGFRSADWQHLRKTLDTPEMFYAWRPLFRYVVVLNKTRSNSNNGVEQG
ncbi:methyltransferase domain-containing protein [Paenibacillus sp. FSL H7-0331]|uniref:methyltransferase domain-containing protein n=1 Tax=Paenibacillus sp. FSL H7-0331 TaxID=1920421 RepID=UPI00096DD8D7|nr:methyltransferase domain-containing protein [Paenibacillus sp. FSL H7-0331]OMF19106.1 stilbene synthase [Paenibacillus sp. FSL H7-0331]